MIHASTIQLLRFKFSYFLMPVFWFALSFVDDINWVRAAIIFFVLHVLLYPSSNGYNSFMDRDEDSIGGIAKPMQPTKQLYYASVIMDAAGIVISFIVSVWFAAAFIVYVICSRLYSYRGVRLKQYPVIGYITVIANQGALTFWMVYYGASAQLLLQLPWLGLIAAAFLIGGFYPITQVYQHEADRKDGVRTISMLLGKRGTFVYCAVMYTISFGLLFVYYSQQDKLFNFIVLSIFFVPVIVFFLKWFAQVWNNEEHADFKHTMRMNWIASTCTNAAFITLLILKQFG